VCCKWRVARGDSPARILSAVARAGGEIVDAAVPRRRDSRGPSADTWHANTVSRKHQLREVLDVQALVLARMAKTRATPGAG
jgi:hypothetical protein